MTTVFAFIHAAFHVPTTRAYRVVQGAVWVLIVLSIVLLIVEAFLPPKAAAAQVLLYADRVLLSIFALEIILRVVSYQPIELTLFERSRIGRARVHLIARLRYLLRPLTLVDVVAVLALFPELRGLRALRLLRLLRTTKVFRYRNPFAIVLQSFEENGLLFAFAFSALGIATVLGGVSMFLIENRVNPDIGSVQDGVWWALVTLTTVGFGDIVPVTLLGRIVGGVLMIAGMFMLALFAGIVGSSFVRGMLSIREEQFRMGEYANHVIVCGYDESTHILLSAVLSEFNLDETRVVIMDDHERPRELPPEFLWVQGNPTKESELDKLRPTHARAVIVSGARDMTPQTADARTILITFTVRAYLSRKRHAAQQRQRPLYVVAEILDSENANHARTAGADEVIETRKIGYSLLAHSVRFHGIATTMSSFLLSGAHNVYIGQIPQSAAEVQTYGKLLAKIGISKQGGLVIGVRTPSGKEIINPSSGHKVQPGTLLIYLAQGPLLDAPA